MGLSARGQPRRSAHRSPSAAGWARRRARGHVRDFSAGRREEDGPDFRSLSRLFSRFSPARRLISQADTPTGGASFFQQRGMTVPSASDRRRAGHRRRTGHDANGRESHSIDALLPPRGLPPSFSRNFRAFRHSSSRSPGFDAHREQCTVQLTLKVSQKPKASKTQRFLLIPVGLTVTQ